MHCGQAWRHRRCLWCLLVIPDRCILPVDVGVVAGGVEFAVHRERVVAVSFGHHFSAAPAIDLLCRCCHGGGWCGCVTVATAGGVVFWWFCAWISESAWVFAMVVQAVAILVLMLTLTWRSRVVVIERSRCIKEYTQRRRVGVINHGSQVNGIRCL